ncbi:hypothetical protein M0812_17883 [Anaeramoeba flamelloides]|uniref:Uncharacterized protein n=1 Tax=Anaeramoeba flamelloides TaxID=1746091 RepID=A0AAV7Z498_9EUKA|nr:hypothetical protein M0812_17883 [Anaeramoeba flamelloides]
MGINISSVPQKETLSGLFDTQNSIESEILDLLCYHLQKNSIQTTKKEKEKEIEKDKEKEIEKEKKKDLKLIIKQKNQPDKSKLKPKTETLKKKQSDNTKQSPKKNEPLNKEKKLIVNLNNQKSLDLDKKIETLKINKEINVNSDTNPNKEEKRQEEDTNKQNDLSTKSNNPQKREDDEQQETPIKEYEIESDQIISVDFNGINEDEELHSWNVLNSSHDDDYYSKINVDQKKIISKHQEDFENEIYENFSSFTFNNQFLKDKEKEKIDLDLLSKLSNKNGNDLNETDTEDEFETDHGLNYFPNKNNYDIYEETESYEDEEIVFEGEESDDIYEEINDDDEDF